MAKAVLIPGKEKRVLGGHPWVFRSDIAQVSGTYEPGDVLDVVSSRGRFLGRAFYNPKSQISLRMMTLHDEPVDRDFIFRRVREAVEYRRAFADLHSCRLIFAESDRLPALIVDSFGDVLVMQCLALGMERYKQDVTDALVELLHPAGIYERSDVPVRALEGLEQYTGLRYGQVPDRVEMVENGVHFWVDVKQGQKTGFFLDQKENRAAIAPFVRDARVLDCFTHTGSFALHAGHYGAREVTGVDISEYACQFATENARLNSLEDRVYFQEANAFDLLAEQSRHGEKYDVIILDPPAFTKTRAAVASAARGYKEINLRAMKMVRGGGLSGHLLLLTAHSARTLPGDRPGRCPGCPRAAASGGIPHPGPGSSHPPRGAGNPVSQVRHFPVASLIRQAEHHQAIRILLLEVGNGRFHGFPYRQIVHVLLHHVPDEACGFGFLAQRLIARLTRLSLFQLSRQARFFCLCLAQLGFTIRQFRRQGILVLLELVKLCFQGLRSACVRLCCGELLAHGFQGCGFFCQRGFRCRCCRLGLRQADLQALLLRLRLRQCVCCFLSLSLKRRIAHRQLVPLCGYRGQLLLPGFFPGG